MYIPKLRNAAAIAEYYKKHDSETAVTTYLLRTLGNKKKLTCRYIEGYYNSIRLHGYNNNQTPNQKEKDYFNNK